MPFDPDEYLKNKSAPAPADAPSGGFDPDAYLQAGKTDEEEAPERDTWKSVLSGAAQGATSGFADEAAAGVGGFLDYVRQGGKLGLSDYYKIRRDLIRKEDKTRQEANPTAYGVAEVGGGVAQAFVPGLNVSKAAMVGKPGLVKAAAHAGESIAHGAASAYGNSEAESGSQQAMDALMGGLTGGATHGVLKGAAKAAPEVGKKGGEALGFLTGGKDKMNAVTRYADDMDAHDAFRDQFNTIDEGLDKLNERATNKVKGLQEGKKQAFQDVQIADADARAESAQEMFNLQSRSQVSDDSVSKADAAMSKLMKDIGANARTQRELLTNMDAKIPLANTKKSISDEMMKYRVVDAEGNPNFANTPEVEQLGKLLSMVESFGDEVTPDQAKLLQKSIDEQLQAMYNNPFARKVPKDRAGYNARTALRDELRNASPDNAYQELSGKLSKDLSLKDEASDLLGSKDDYRGSLDRLLSHNNQEKFAHVKALDERTGAGLLGSLKDTVAARDLLKNSPELQKHLQSLPQAQRASALRQVLADVTAQHEALGNANPNQVKAAVHRLLNANGNRGLADERSLVGKVGGDELLSDIGKMSTIAKIEKGGPQGSRLTQMGRAVAGDLGALAGGVLDYGSGTAIKGSLKGGIKAGQIIDRIENPARKAMMVLLINQAVNDPEAAEYANAVAASENPEATLESLKSDPAFKAKFAK